MAKEKSITFVPRFGREKEREARKELETVVFDKAKESKLHKVNQLN